MKYSKGKVSDIQVAYIGGGSRGWAWTFMTDLALEDSEPAEPSVYMTLTGKQHRPMK